ncbi:MAG: HEAT repeat domain-containing protein [bacterium]|nr:HEAT repeat domain-containing protein [bacterium]
MRWSSLTVCGAILACIGCTGPLPRTERVSLRDRALYALKSKGPSYTAMPSVRAQAIEALEQVAPESGRSRIRAMLTDPHPGVRFAACVALGSLDDRLSKVVVEKRLTDPDASVQAAAVFALHRMGDPRYSEQLATFLLEHEDPAVRRNAAMLLGRLGEEGAIALLARVMTTKDDALRLQALDSMARLGSREAVQELKFTAYSGEGAQQTLAVLALAELRDPTLTDLFQIRLERARHLETRLAAAWGLGHLGSDAGYSLAVGSLSFSAPKRAGQKDPPEVQTMRVRQLAARALGAIGKPEALPALCERMDHDVDPRVQLAAAMAIVQLTEDLDAAAVPFAASIARPK